MQRENAQTLADYVLQLMTEKRLSSYKIAENAGGAIDQSTVNRIKNGKVINPSAPTLKALAKGLGISEEEIFSIVRGKLPDLTNLANEQLESLVRKFERLPASKKNYAQALINLLNREFERLLDEGQFK